MVHSACSYPANSSGKSNGFGGQTVPEPETDHRVQHPLGGKQVCTGTKLSAVKVWSVEDVFGQGATKRATFVQLFKTFCSLALSKPLLSD